MLLRPKKDVTGPNVWPPTKGANDQHVFVGQYRRILTSVLSIAFASSGYTFDVDQDSPVLPSKTFSIGLIQVLIPL